MKIKDRAEYASKSRPLTCSRDATVTEVSKEMSAKNFGSVVVVDRDQRIEGLVTERDIMKRIVAEGRDAATTKVSDIMTTDVRTAREDDDVVDWLRIMSNDRFRRLPIVDADGRLASVMTQGDFVSFTWPDLITQARSIAGSQASKNYQILLIVGGVLAYTVGLVGLVAAIL